MAFHAWSDSYPVQVAAHGTIVLNHAATNVGNAYDALTGVFTAPVSGLYDFQASIMDYHLNSGSYVRGAIYVDSSIEAITLSDSRHGFHDHGTMKAIVHVNAGQRVYLKNPDNAAHDYYDGKTFPYTSFSGFLIKAD